MKKKIVIVRHGNTFLPTETPTRVGAKTDLPLVEKDKATKVAKWLLENNIIPNTLYSSPLKRTIQTSEIINCEMKLNCNIQLIECFREVDYGPDENKTEEEVIKRLGEHHLKLEGRELSDIHEITRRGKTEIENWDKSASVPHGWRVNIEEIKNCWKNFASDIVRDNETALVCSSNGIIRFAPYILAEGFNEFTSKNKIKVATGGISILEQNNDDEWFCRYWNIRPV